ncbi:MAG: polyprenyl synthetase family protein [Candidatus Paceibacterota bacterium]
MKNIYLDQLEETLTSLIKELPTDGSLQESASYMLFNQGKRIRPSIIVAILDDLKLLNQQHFALALSVEILHTASLIHDDLPALDNDDYRRGKLSCHKKYSESQAVLLGDYSHAWAFQIASLNASPEHLQEIIQVLAAVYQSVCLGQILDMNQGVRPDFCLINKLKTAALFAGSFQIAGIAGNLNQAQVEKMQQLGEDFGLIFQLINDFKDSFLSPESTGRKESSDFKNNKQTAISHFETAREAKIFLEEQIFTWNKSFELVKQDFNNQLVNLSKVVDSVLLSVH